MKDWANNKISEGDTIVVVRTSPLIKSSSFCIMDFSIGKTEVLSTYTSPEYIWEIIGEFSVVKYGDKLYYQSKMEDMIYNFDLSMGWRGQPSDLICIKGKSDNQEKYYLEYFKV